MTLEEKKQEFYKKFVDSSVLLPVAKARMYFSPSIDAKEVWAWVEELVREEREQAFEDGMYVVRCEDNSDVRFQEINRKYDGID